MLPWAQARLAACLAVVWSVGSTEETCITDSTPLNLASTCDPPTTESVSSDVGNRDHALHTRMSEDSRCCHGHRHGWQRAWRWCGHTCEGYRNNFLRSAGNQSKENFSCYLPHQGNQSAGSRKTYPSPTHMMSLCPVPWMPRRTTASADLRLDSRSERSCDKLRHLSPGARRSW